jgi:carotenoid 1,2-hydratase
MIIQHGPQTDVLHAKPHHGAYEWWYFDGIDQQQGLAWVLIFYQGNPFSPWYLQDPEARAEDYPAVTLSLYKEGDPIYYSFIEYDQNDVEFNTDLPDWRIGDHRLTFQQTDDQQWEYRLTLSDQLPSGDQLQGEITYRSTPMAEGWGDAITNADDDGHAWTLVQPRAQVEGRLDIVDAHNGEQLHMELEGLGYHDHNVGQEPMQKDFTDWYWGRLHFETTTLIYYVMQRASSHQFQAWLLDPTNHRVIDTLKEVDLEDYTLNPFLLNSARKLELEFENHQALVQQHPIIDNGPFYQRFLGSGILHGEGEPPQTARGITEYIHPGRIEHKRYHPLVKMRLHRKPTQPHWVQKSPRLYRWTW